MKILCSLLMCACMAYSQQVIDTTSGKIQGKSLNVDGKALDVYLGIPFAEPPTGPKRFRRPEPGKPWDGILKATELPNTCPQPLNIIKGMEMLSPNTKMDEDCLYLNIWIPKYGSQSQKKAVMIFIYGGGFTSGSSTLDVYNGQYLAAENDVIVASMQYRIGAFGFLFLDDIGAPGNMGLLDQNLAMKWIHDNIEAFDGDSNQITIFGESAGSISVGFHLLSPMSRDLFKYGIMESGTPYFEAMTRKPEHSKEQNLEMAKKMGCTSDDTQNILKCLHDLDMDEIVKNQCTGQINEICPLPTNDNYFLTKSPNEYVSSDIKKTPILTGVTANEGTLFLALYNPRLHNVTHDVQMTATEYDQWVKGMALSSPLAEKALHFVYDVPCHPDDPQQSYRQRAADMMGDSWFVCPALQFANLYAESDNVFFYEYGHHSAVFNTPAWFGASHGEELVMVFGHPLNKSMNFNRQEEALSRRMMQYWTNFAKTGNPNIDNSNEWMVYGKNKEYLELNTDQRTMKKDLHQFQCAFWNDIFPEFKKSGIETSHASRADGRTLVMLMATCIAWMCKTISL